MGESRTELIAWINELLQLNYTKVEQCGTGGAYCQIIDSIYGDVPMNRVKMNAKHEYEFIANFKVLQNIFKAKKIEKPIPVEKLVKCKMQDNLEFLQWIKKFWDANFGGQGYDPVARRRGAPTDTPATIAPIGGGTRSVSGAGLHTGGARAGGRTPVGGPRAGSAQSNEAVHALRNQVQEMSQHLEGLEKERDFYFAKLRDIEILVQQQMEENEKTGTEDLTLTEIQKILYSTEEGFEVPEGAPAVDEEETF
ncbi:EB1 domain-containing protein [Fomitiporia mediterranea MF3/22]|uniref:EB1 domain-containing protein n=1 Tax=Fomitiporia mediterranea (strain MF3/22) TaxID=694068 RepID=UPI0004409CA0|nr:EB1 domain-containing protein [Fomitiporia mediterranea MF3/22]EJC98350.1 EB1 domain-containing protein [Fomitiporia mediterranea MF3/22]